MKSVKYEVYIEPWDSILRDPMKTVPIMWDIHIRQAVCPPEPHWCQEACHFEIVESSNEERRA
jgi:hypothetical protein